MVSVSLLKPPVLRILRRILSDTDWNVWHYSICRQPGGEHRPLVGEFSFETKFDRREDVSRKAENLVKQFFVTLQRDIRDWVWLGTTKTRIVYQLKDSLREGHK